MGPWAILLRIDHAEGEVPLALPDVLRPALDVAPASGRRHVAGGHYRVRVAESVRPGDLGEAVGPPGVVVANGQHSFIGRLVRKIEVV